MGWGPKPDKLASCALRKHLAVGYTTVVNQKA